MAGLPINFALLQEGAVSSYSWSDVAEGTGIIELDGLTAIDSTTTTYTLSEKIGFTAGTSTGGGSGFNGTTTMVFYLSPFNKPKIIQGTAYFYFSMAGYGPDQAGGTKSVYAVLKLYKFSGGVSTQIGSTKTSATITAGRNAFAVSNNLMSTAITSTSFKIGDQLYLEVGFVQTGTANSHSWFFHDPLNRVFKSFIDGGIVNADLTTYLKVYIPQKIEL